MSIHTPSLSSSAESAISARLSDLADRPNYAKRELMETLAGSGPNALEVALPHDVYNLPLNSLVKAAEPDDAEQVGRRCLVTSGGATVASVELPDPDGEKGVVTTHGQFTEATADAVRGIQDASEVESGDFDLRMLRIPALYLMALWLKDRQGRNDIFVPLEPAPPELEAGARYSWNELRTHLEKPAQMRLAQDEEDETRGPQETM